MGKDIFALKNIISYCEDIEDTIERFGDEESFIEDKHYRDLCSFYMIQIGENIKALSEKTREDHPGIRWRGFRETRDDIAHKYHKVDIEKIWFTVAEEIPALKEKCEEILREIRS